jgi:ribosomal protein S18 acetylase RimI-like enzyme
MNHSKATSVCRQLTREDHLSGVEYDTISRLIYDTDPYIYPALFGDGEIGLSNARKILPVVFESGQDSMFRKQNLFLLYREDKIVSLILWIKGDLDWDPYSFLSCAEKAGVLLNEANVLAVAARYVGSRYNVRSAEDSSVSLINVCVDSSCRGQGLGKNILGAFLAGHDHELVKLCVLADNQNAVRLYSSAGFQITCKSTGFSLHGEPPECYDMERKQK